MSESFSTRGLKALFSYPFRQRGWDRKMLILTALCVAGFIFPIIPWLAVAGFMAEIMRRTAEQGGEPELPEWTDWGAFFMDGLRLAGIAVVFSLPLLVIFSCGFGPYLFSMFGMALSDPYGREMNPYALLMMGSSMLVMLSMVCAFAYIALIGIPIPAALVHVVVKRSLPAIFRVLDWWKVFRANLGGFIIVTILIWVTAYFLQFVTLMLTYTVILCALAVVAPLLITPYVSILSAYLYGQAYREGLENLALAGADGLEPVFEAEPKEPDQAA